MMPQVTVCHENLLLLLRRGEVILAETKLLQLSWSHDGCRFWVGVGRAQQSPLKCPVWPQREHFTPQAGHCFRMYRAATALTLLTAFCLLLSDGARCV